MQCAKRAVVVVKVEVEVVAVDAVDISAVEDYAHERKMRSKNPHPTYSFYIFNCVTPVSMATVT